MRLGLWGAVMLSITAWAVFPGAPASAQSSEPDHVAQTNLRTLTIARVSGNPRKHAARLMALGRHIVTRHPAFDEVEVILKHKPEEMVAAAARGEIDLVSETVFSALQIEGSGQMEMALLEWKENIRSYHSVILVRADSPFRKLEDLRGARIAFEDPGSTSGFFLPYVEIMDAGLEMVADGSGKASSEHVRYLYGGAEINVVGSLVRGRVDAAAISNLDIDDDEVVTDRFRDSVRVLHETRSVPRSVMLMRASLPVPVRDQIKEILLGMHQTETGRSVLRQYFKIGKFEPMDEKSQDEFRWVRDAYNAHHAR